LRDALSAAAFKDRLGERSLRGADGTRGRNFPAAQGAPATAQRPLQMPDVASLDRALSTWSAVTAPARLLAVLDVSGSMKTPVPTAGNATRMQLTQAAAKRGLSLFDDNWAVGLWTFSTQMDPGRDFHEAVPVGPMSTQRDQLARAIDETQVKLDGNTALYDTTLAGYKTMKDGWEEGKVNSLVIVTDGENHDDAGLTLDQLIVELKKLVDPKKPVQVIYIGIGSTLGEAAMKAVTDTTGGGVFVANDPANISEIFLKAIASRPGSPVR
jgi:Ca-activated chloride channel family protein